VFVLLLDIIFLKKTSAIFSPQTAKEARGSAVIRGAAQPKANLVSTMNTKREEVKRGVKKARGNPGLRDGMMEEIRGGIMTIRLGEVRISTTSLIRMISGDPIANGILLIENGTARRSGTAGTARGSLGIARRNGTAGDLLIRNGVMINGIMTVALRDSVIETRRARGKERGKMLIVIGKAREADGTKMRGMPGMAIERAKEKMVKDLMERGKEEKEVILRRIKTVITTEITSNPLRQCPLPVNYSVLVLLKIPPRIQLLRNPPEIRLHPQVLLPKMKRKEQKETKERKEREKAKEIPMIVEKEIVGKEIAKVLLMAKEMVKAITARVIVKGIEKVI
jgi:hypothetical protein